MVTGRERAQLFTIEGMLAAVLMVGTGLIIMNSTTLYTPADTHIYDLQFEQLGYDLLKALDTAETYDYTLAPYEAKMSPLEERALILSADPTGTFDDLVVKYLNIGTEGNSIQYCMNAITLDENKESLNPPIRLSPKTETLSEDRFKLVKKTEHLVRATRFVSTPNSNDPSKPQVCLVEVYLWR